jgi:hypothetical protein
MLRNGADSVIGPSGRESEVLESLVVRVANVIDVKSAVFEQII